MAADPISIIGLAAKILQFVEFGSRLLLESRTIYQSYGAALDANAEIEIVTALAKLPASVFGMRSRFTLMIDCQHTVGFGNAGAPLGERLLFCCAKT